ncbi:hypothetical protein CLU79DRAFT_700558, partial [Phycomyces nitens]
IATGLKCFETAIPDKSFLCCPILSENTRQDVHMKETSIKLDYVRYTVQYKARFCDLNIEKCTSASAASKQFDIHIRTDQRRVNQCHS